MSRRRNADSDEFVTGEPVAHGPLVGKQKYELGWSLETTPSCNGPRDTRALSRMGSLRVQLETGEVVDLDCDNFTPLRRFDPPASAVKLSPALRDYIRLNNPLMPGPPPRYMMGGMGTPMVWTYQGRTISTRPGKTQDWAAEWSEPEEENQRTSAWGRDEQEALANARYKIDLYAKTGQYDDYHLAEGLVQHVMDWMHDATKDKPTRANVARQIKMISAEVAKTTRGEQRKIPAVAKYNVEAFDRLPLPERVKLIDEAIDYQVRANLWEPERLPNPLRRRIEELDRKANLLCYNPPTPKVLPVIKRGMYPEMILGTVGTKSVYRYRGFEIEILKNIPDVWDVNITTPPGMGSDEFVSSRTFDGAVCLGKLIVDLRIVTVAFGPPEAGYLTTTWADIGTLAHNEAGQGRLPTRAAVARALHEGRQKAGDRGHAPRWQWFDALPLGDRVQLIDDRLELSYCAYGKDLHFWP